MSHKVHERYTRNISAIGNSEQQYIKIIFLPMIRTAGQVSPFTFNKYYYDDHIKLHEAEKHVLCTLGSIMHAKL
jgi:hypothetical protein